MTTIPSLAKAQAQYDAQQPPDRPAPEYAERALWEWVRDRTDGETEALVEEKIAQVTGWNEDDFIEQAFGSWLTDTALASPNTAPDWLRGPLAKAIAALCDEYRDRYETWLAERGEGGRMAW